MATTLSRQPKASPGLEAADTAATLRNYRHPMCMSEDVVEQPRGFTLLDEQVAAFQDLCIHRGTALSLGEIPIDLRDELHLKVPDANAFMYRRLLSRIKGIAPHLP